jgi:hypothetical protein
MENHMDFNHFDNVEDAYSTIINDSKYENINNNYFIWEVNNKFVIETRERAKKEWKLFRHKDVVRSIRLLNKENLFFSSLYKLLVGRDFIKIEVNSLINDYSHYCTIYTSIIEAINKIQLLLLCRLNYEDFKEHDKLFDLYNTHLIMSILFYPIEKIKSIHIPLDQSKNKILSDIYDFGKQNLIRIEYGEDEIIFFKNPVIKEKIAWKDFLFEYHKGVCISFDWYCFDLVIKKVPEIFWDEGGLFYTYNNIIGENYIELKLDNGGFENCKYALNNFLKIREENQEHKKEIFLKKTKDFNIRSSNNRSHSADSNSNYRWDLDMDQQSPEFWDSL